MRYGGIYLYILCSFKKDVVIDSLRSLPSPLRCLLSLSLVYIAAKP